MEKLCKGARKMLMVCVGLADFSAEKAVNAIDMLEKRGEKAASRISASRQAARRNKEQQKKQRDECKCRNMDDALDSLASHSGDASTAPHPKPAT